MTMTRILSKYNILTPSMEQSIESDNPKMYSTEKVNQILCDAMRFAGVPLRYIVPTDDLPDPAYENAFNSVYVFGNVGTGKTYYICNLIKHCLFFQFRHRGIMTWDNIHFIEVPELLLNIRTCFSENQSEKEFIRKYTQYDYLFLDDLGVEKCSEWTLQTLYLIINRRYAQNKHLCITSNYSLNELSEKMDDSRITSRIKGMCKILKTSGKDKRIHA